MHPPALEAEVNSHRTFQEEAAAAPAMQEMLLPAVTFSLSPAPEASRSVSFARVDVAEPTAVAGAPVPKPWRCASARKPLRWPSPRKRAGVLTRGVSKANDR